MALKLQTGAADFKTNEVPVINDSAARFIESWKNLERSAAQRKIPRRDTACYVELRLREI